MSELDTALILRMEASLAKFENQMARARKAGSDSATRIEKQFANSNRKMAQSAESSARVIGAEMERLKVKYDPAYAASKRYQQALDELNQAQRLGAIETKQYEAALKALDAEHGRVASSATRAAAANTKVATSTRGMSGGIQNVSFQLQDFAVQVGAGTAASVALGQQLPQLLGGFGVLGAVLGAVVAIGIPLAASFFRSGVEAEDLADRADTLRKAVGDYQAAAEGALIPTDELAKKYGTATAAAREFIDALKEITRVDALDALQKSADAIASSFGNLGSSSADELREYGRLIEEYAGRTRDRSSNPDPEMARRVMEIMQANEALGELSTKLDLTYGQAGTVAGALAELASAEGPQEAVDAAQNLLDILETTIGPYEAMNGEAKALYNEIRNAGDQASQLLGTSEGIAPAIGGAVSEAGRLADELGRAVQNAINLSAQGLSDVKRAKIEYEFRDDPVRRAGALAKARAEEEIVIPEGAGGTITNELMDQRRAYVNAAEEAERYRQKVIAWREAEAEAASAAAKSSSSGRKAATKAANKAQRDEERAEKDEEKFFDASDAELASAERRITLIGKTQSEIAELEARYNLLDEAKKRGLDLDARYGGSSETLAQEIDRQSQAIGELAEIYEQASTKADFFAKMQADVQSGILDTILEGESLKGVLGGVAKAFARAAVEAALFSSGPFGSGNAGGGLLGGLFKAMMPARAAGGPVRAGSAYKVGEHGPEPFLPAVNGRILSTAQAQAALRGNDERPNLNVSFAPVINAPGADQGAAQRIERHLAQMERNLPDVIMQTLRNGGNRGAIRKVVR
ncbi:hypothetical protein LX81_00284 [Palleronia aestuarii]|uniref:Tail length tape measure protein n=1 Tax=Palleronia aestuarii TaxID=568105 RepID=A0A2W7NHB7_9RHOB|nr:hypothetical protein [Palleronia aestuarii]PZX19821.1 hypothetical protein LX81_00284 [Palleronia aestuarii]